MFLGFGAFFVGWFALWAVGLVVWVLSIIEVVKIPDHQFRMAGTDKVTWVLVVCLAGIIGALIWRFAKRADVMRATGGAQFTPPGWYPDPNGQPRWWDGYGWH